jgi:hypothetical protein
MIQRALATLLLAACAATAAAAAETPANGGFERGSAGWTLTAGPYGRPAQGSAQAARVAKGLGRAGSAALQLDARGRSAEVDAYSAPVPVVAGRGWRLAAWVRALAPKSDYKVTLDWQDAAGKHLKYDNDWRGRGEPGPFTRHGGVFVAPEGAARVVLILGVQPRSCCLFDDISLADAGPAEPIAARTRRNGDGAAVVTGPDRVAAGAYATWRADFTCGTSGLPAGGLIALRRMPTSLDWSDPQGIDPKAQGYVRVRGPQGSEFQVERGQAGMLLVRLVWPALEPGQAVEITIGDRSGGGPGLRAQRTAVKGARWVVGSDCKADGDALDLAHTEGGRFDVVPDRPVRLRVVCPSVVEAGEPVGARVEALDRWGNVCAAPDPPVRWNGAAAAHALPGGGYALAFGRTGTVRLGARAGTLTGIAEPVVVEPLPSPPINSSPRPYGRVFGRCGALANGRVALLFPPAGGGYGPVILYTRSGIGWTRVGTITSPARLALGSGAPALSPIPGADVPFGPPAITVRDGRAEAVLRGSEGGGAVVARFTVSPDSPMVALHVTATPPAGKSVACLTAPLLRAGDGAFGRSHAGALFAGLEYLAPGEASSSDRGVAWKIRDRRVPHPYKVTVPLMVAAGEQGLCGIAWDPNQRWDGRNPLPLARFEAPSPDGADNLAMGISAPGFRRGLPENRLPAPLPGAAGKAVSLNCELLVLPGGSTVPDAVAAWAAAHPMPALRRPRSGQAEMALCTRAFARTCWVPGVQGWYTAVGLKPGYADDLAARVRQLGAAMEPGDAALSATNVTRQAMDAVGGPGGPATHLLVGDPERAMEALRGAAYGRMAQQLPDGGWAFRHIFGAQGPRATLAEPDDVELGSGATALETVLTYAAATGDPAAVRAGLRGLERLDRFIKPAGAESWEVPLTCPNLRAAALATRCFLRGYQITHNPAHLASAHRWAMAGLAFVCLWEPADRPVMPGATISVMGTTFFDQGWFGWPVQWVGLAYAEVIRELARYDPRFDWAGVADLILASAEKQQKPEGAQCGHVGLYPDSYSLLTGADAYEWCLAPTGIVGNLLGKMRAPFEPSIVSAPLPGGTLRGVTFALPIEASAHGGGVRLRLRQCAGASAGGVLYGVTPPASVTWQGRPLPRLEFAPAKGDGWWTGAAEGAVCVRVTFAQEEGDLLLDGCIAAGYRAPQLKAELRNGGFEAATEGWALEPGARLVADGVAYEGRNALLSDGLGAGAEAQATSARFGVKPSVRYRLSAMVHQLAGDGDYKVTLEWLDAASRHIAYANDWTGADKPRDYAAHGGVFTAPDNAASAIIILGTRLARCLFDAVTFTEAP